MGIVTENLANKRAMKKVEFYIQTVGDDLDYTSYVYDVEWQLIGHLNWGFSDNFYPREEDIISFVLVKNRYPHLVKKN